MSPDPFLHHPEHDHPNGVATTSRFRAWWMLHIRKWRLMHHRREPRHATFGQMRYRRTWVLAPPA